MRKEFNDTGTCIPAKHYMVRMDSHLQKVKKLVDKGKYFMINRPRQYGKTTMMYLLESVFTDSDYLVISMSFEGIGDTEFESQQIFCPFFLTFLSEQYSIKQLGLREVFLKHVNKVNSFNTLSSAISDIITELGKPVVLMIDEVDKSSNNQLFLHFIGMLRDKYLRAAKGQDSTFYSVILGGLHDVKSLKLKLRSGEKAVYNSPWNIAVDFDIDMTFHPKDIETMLAQFAHETGIKVAIPEVAEEIYFYTNGYPYFVSKLCKIIDEEIEPTEWKKEIVVESVKIMLAKENNTNFDTVIKNLENNKDLHDFMANLLLNSQEYNYSTQNPLIYKAKIHGLIKNENNKVRVFNKIYEEYILDYYTSKMETSHNAVSTVQSIYLKPDGRLDMKLILTKFSEVIEEKYSKQSIYKSSEFLENELRMQFLVFLKPIINGTGFSYKEVQTSAEKRLDVIVFFKDEKFIVELKMWYGDKYHTEGIAQIKDYMRREHLNQGYMIVMSKNENKKFKFTDEDGLFTAWL